MFVHRSFYFAIDDDDAFRMAMIFHELFVKNNCLPIEISSQVAGELCWPQKNKFTTKNRAIKAISKLIRLGFICQVGSGLCGTNIYSVDFDFLYSKGGIV